MIIRDTDTLVPWDYMPWDGKARKPKCKPKCRCRLCKDYKLEKTLKFVWLVEMRLVDQGHVLGVFIDYKDALAHFKACCIDRVTRVGYKLHWFVIDDIGDRGFTIPQWDERRFRCENKWAVEGEELVLRRHILHV